MTIDGIFEVGLVAEWRATVTLQWITVSKILVSLSIIDQRIKKVKCSTFFIIFISE